VAQDRLFRQRVAAITPGPLGKKSGCEVLPERLYGELERVTDLAGQCPKPIRCRSEQVLDIILRALGEVKIDQQGGLNVRGGHAAG
jgi:hypothetical protein